MEVIRSRICTRFRVHLCREDLRLCYRVGAQRYPYLLRQGLSCQTLVWNRLGTSTSTGNHCAPKWLVPEERNNDCRSASQNTSRSSARSAVMNNGRDVLEEPVMRY